MTIAERISLGKRLGTRFRDALFLAVLLLSSTGSFSLGVLAGRDGEGSGEDFFLEEPEATKIPAAVAVSEKREAVAEENTAAPMPATGGQYVASKSGTKYYLPWCGTAKRIKEENKIWFSTKAEAEAAGFAPGKNCKGL